MLLEITTLQNRSVAAPPVTGISETLEVHDFVKSVAAPPVAGIGETFERKDSVESVATPPAAGVGETLKVPDFVSVPLNPTIRCWTKRKTKLKKRNPHKMGKRVNK